MTGLGIKKKLGDGVNRAENTGENKFNFGGYNVVVLVKLVRTLQVQYYLKYLSCLQKPQEHSVILLR